jgi:CRP-like cAMP-binding protein
MPTKDGRAHSHVPSLGDLFDRASRVETRERFDANEAIYATGDEDASMYLIESGQVKLSISSAAGKDCLLAIYAAGEVFGESCLSGRIKRVESATATQPTAVRRVPARDFLSEAEKAKAVEALIRHLSERLIEREIAIFDLVTMPSERRLAKVLLGVAEKLGTTEGPFLRLDQKISHEELSQIVGTTRPRITAFMQRFRTLGLIETTGRAINVHRQKTRAFIESD